jgi:hypothetical protein
MRERAKEALITIHKSGTDVRIVRLKAVHVFYFPTCSPSMFYSYLSSLSSSSTTTTYLILNSTLTTTVVTSCVPIAQFTTFPAGVTLTNACRRRRDAAAALDQILIGNDDPNYFDQPFSNLYIFIRRSLFLFY